MGDISVGHLKSTETDQTSERVIFCGTREGQGRKKTETEKDALPITKRWCQRSMSGRLCQGARKSEMWVMGRKEEEKGEKVKGGGCGKYLKVRKKAWDGKSHGKGPQLRAGKKKKEEGRKKRKTLLEK